MKFSRLFDALFELLCLALLSIYQLAILIMFGWWIIVHDILDYLVKKVPEKLQLLMLPLVLIMLIFSPFYGLAIAGLLGLQEGKKRLRFIMLNIKSSFNSQT